jgi:hypothetical protein
MHQRPGNIQQEDVSGNAIADQQAGCIEKKGKAAGN